MEICLLNYTFVAQWALGKYILVVERGHNRILEILIRTPRLRPDIGLTARVNKKEVNPIHHSSKRHTLYAHT